MDVYVIQQQHNRMLDEEKMSRQEEFPLKLLPAILSYKAAAHRDLRKGFYATTISLKCKNESAA